MVDPPSDRNEHVADIFMVSTDEAATVLLKESLEKNGYRVTVLPDETPPGDNFLDENVNLLIYDSKTGGKGGYDLIRQIKADEHLRVIPILILTSASTMEELLLILESNADNFIAPPYNLPDNLSLIEDMLATPGWWQKQDEIIKQFKIRHDDYTYAVAATSRKLLEYLLSSFEILAAKSSELSSMRLKLREVSDSLQELEQTATRQTRDIEILNSHIREKDQKIFALTRDADETRETLLQKMDEIQILKGESDNDKAHLANVENTLNEEKVRNISLETALHDLTFELEQQKSAVVAERSRSESKELEINTLRQAKTQSEHDLNQIINELKETAKQPATELARLRSELEAETNLRVSAEVRAGVLQRKLEQFQNTSHSETDALRRQVGELQNALAVSASAPETRREMRRISEEKTNASAQQQEDLENRIRIANEENIRANTIQAAIIVNMKEELKTADLQKQHLETDNSAPAREKSDAREDVMLPTEPEQTDTLPESETDDQPGIDEGPADTVKERQLVQQPLFRAAEDNPPEENQGLVVSEELHLPVIVQRELSAEESPAADNQTGQPAFSGDVKENSGTAKRPDSPGSALKSVRTPGEPKGKGPAGEISFNSNQWLDLLKWVHHSDALSEDQRVKIIRMGRLIQKDRKLTKNQQDQVREILSLVHALGYNSG
ncbi:MAG TPA: response regulator [Methanoregulaceae archaeon]|nr:response regulator [Methanoregulaceae archaeon]